MNDITRRKLMKTGIAAAAGISGLGVAATAGRKSGCFPPDPGGLYGIGETLNYATHRLLANHSSAREFRREEISAKPFANEIGPPLKDDFKTFESQGFANWRLVVDGLVDRPASFSVADLKNYPSRSQITHLACEEGWSYIAEWIGVPLAHVLDLVGAKPQARYVAYFSIQREWWDSIDIDEARHPQTLVAHGMNGGELPVGFGGPLRMSVPRQLGYKSVKFINHLILADDLKSFGKGLGSAAPEGGYAWYAGI